MKSYLPYRPYLPYLTGVRADESVVLESIAVTPAAQTINDGATLQFTATGTYDDASTADITATVTWESDDTDVATIDAAGLATGTGPGQATISATLGAVSGDTTLDVAFVPLSLFASSEAGAYYDPRDMASLAQDSANTTPVTAYGQNVGYMADKSGNGKHLIQATAGTRPWLVDSSNPRLLFDSDRLATIAAIDFTGTQKVTVVAALSKVADTDTQLAVEFSANGFSTAGGWYITQINDVVGTDKQCAASANAGASGYGYTEDASYAAPRALTLTAIFDASQAAVASEITLRANGSEIPLTYGGVTIGAGNFGNHTLNVGGRSNGTVPLLQGSIGRLIVIGRLLTPAELAAAEAWVGHISDTVVAAVGDSTVATYPTGNFALPWHCNFDGRLIAVPAHTIAQQKTAWSARADKATFEKVVVQVGLNDMNPAEAASVAIARLQDLIDTINADVTVPVYIAQMIPCKQRWIDYYGAVNGLIAQQKWVDMNEAIAGNGATPITGVDGRITTHVALMDDGSGNLAAAYDTGDHIHPNNLGRAVNAAAWMGVIGA